MKIIVQFLLVNLNIIDSIYTTFLFILPCFCSQNL